MTTTAIKHPVSGLGALLVMGGMFWVLSVMLQHHVEVVIKPTHKINFTPLIVDTEEIPDPPIKTYVHESIPDVPPIVIGDFGPPDGGLISGPPSVETDVDGGLPASIDGDVTPLFRLQPLYPRRAQERGIEGWVALQFTITASGTVRDPVIVDSNPKGYFEDASVAALLR